MTVRAARAAYYEANGLSEEANRARWVKLKVGPVPFAFPNTASRQRALPMHDLHHLATGYATTVIGELEIGAWELAGGIGNYWAAWALDLSGFATGLVIAPRRIYRAFVRGRHSRTLYLTGWDDALLDLTVDELRARLGVDREVRATWRDRLAFVGWSVLCQLPLIAALAIALRLV